MEKENKDLWLEIKDFSIKKNKLSKRSLDLEWQVEEITSKAKLFIVKLLLEVWLKMVDDAEKGNEASWDHERWMGPLKMLNGIEDVKRKLKFERMRGLVKMEILKIRRVK